MNGKRRPMRPGFGLENCFYNTLECAIPNFNNHRNEFVAFDKIIVAVRFRMVAFLLLPIFKVWPEKRSDFDIDNMWSVDKVLFSNHGNRIQVRFKVHKNRKWPKMNSVNVEIALGTFPATIDNNWLERTNYRCSIRVNSFEHKT